MTTRFYRLSFIVFAIVFASTLKSFAEGPSILPIKTISETSLALDMQANLPRAANLDPALRAHIDMQIESDLTAMRDTATQDYKEFGTEDFWRPYSMSISWDEHFVSPRLISLLQTRYEYTGGAHGNSRHSSLLWDTEAHTEITLADLFQNTRSGAQSLLAITSALRDELIRQKIERMNMDPKGARTDQGLEELRASTDVLGTFTLMPSDQPGKIGGLVFHFAPYVLGSYAEGSYHLGVPAKAFRNYLAPKFKPLFGGEPITFETLSNHLAPGVNIMLRHPQSGNNISAPLELSGEAPDFWFENGEAHVEVRDGDENLIGAGVITASKKVPASGAASGMVYFSGNISFKPQEKDSFGKVTFWRGSGEGDEGNRMRVEWWVSF